MSPANVMAAIGGSGLLELGSLPSMQARPLIARMQSEGLEVAAEGASYFAYLPENRTTGCATIIDDDDEARAFVQAMLEAGVPVVDSTE